MAKCTPSFNKLIAARGGTGTNAGSKKTAPPMPKTGKVKDTDRDGN